MPGASCKPCRCSHWAGERHLAPRLCIKLLKQLSFSQQSFLQKKVRSRLRGNSERAESLVKYLQKWKNTVSACCILGPYFQWFNKRDVFQLWEACCVYYLPRSIFALYKMTEQNDRNLSDVSETALKLPLSPKKEEQECFVLFLKSAFYPLLD